MKLFFGSTMRISALVLWGLSFAASPAFATALAPVDSLTLSTQDQKALQRALPSEVETENTATTLVWQGNPLSLVLPLQQEKRLVFSEPVQVDVNGQVTTAQLRVINDHQNVYLTALQPLTPKTRLYVTLKNSGQIIFLDLSTSDESEENEKNEKKQTAAADTIQIQISPALQRANSALNRQNLHSDSVVNPELLSAEKTPSFDAPFFSASADDLVQAVRFAWQQLYAPSYLLSLSSNTLDFIRTPLHTPFWVSGLFYSDAVFAHPLAAWTHGDLFITAVELRNPYPHPVPLNVSGDVCGQWRAALLYPRTLLQPMGEKPADSTTLFLIADQPFDRVLKAGGCDHGRA